MHVIVHVPCFIVCVYRHPLLIGDTVHVHMSPYLPIMKYIPVDVKYNDTPVVECLS